MGALAKASVSGQLKSSTDIYAQKLGEPTDTVVPYLNLDLNGKEKISKKWRLQWQASVVSNPKSQTAPEKLFPDVKEAFIQYKESPLELRAGYNTVNWGVVDISSPSDVINPSAFFHPLRISKRGSPMIEAQIQEDNWSLHAIYIPRQQKAALPSADSRWLPRKFIINEQVQGIKILLPDFFEYQIDSSQELDHALDHNSGLRFTAHVGSFDLSLMHFEGAAPQPKVKPIINMNANEVQSPVLLRPIYYRIETTGLGVVLAQESFILRMESAYQHTISDSPLVQPWSWSNVVGIETNVDIGSTTATVLAQYYYTKNPQSPDNMISSNYRLFDRTVMIGTRWAYSDELLFTASALAETTTSGFFLMASFEQKLGENLKWGAGWRDFSASKDGLLKTFDRNDHANIEIIYYF